MSHPNRVIPQRPKNATYQRPPVTRVHQGNSPVGAVIAMDGPLVSAHVHLGPDGSLLCVGQTSKFRIALK